MAAGTRSMSLLLAAVLFAGAAGADRDEFRSRLKEGTALVAKSAFADALRVLEPLAADPLGADPEFAGDLHYYIGQAYYRLVKYADADQHWQMAIERERAAHDRAGEARTLRAVAQMRKNEGRYPEGLELGKAAVDIYDEIGDRRNAALGWIVLGAIHDLIGDHQQALESYQHAVPTLGGEKSSNGANLLYEMGITYKNLGNYTEALRCYNQALDIYTQLNETRNRAVVLGNIGVLYGTIGDDERGLLYSNRALTLAREVGDRRGEAVSLLNVADSYWRIGQRERAVAALNEELALTRDIGARTEMALAYKNLGDIHAVQGETTLARTEYEQALRIQEDMGEHRTESSTLIALSDLALRDHRNTEALDLARRAMAMADQTGRLELEWDARRSLAAANAAAGRQAEAIDELRDSARIINDLRATVTADASKIDFVDQRQDVFQDLALLLVGAGRNDEALEAAEASRARAFADLLEQRQVLGKPRGREALAAVRRAAVELRNAAADSSAAPAATSSSSPGTRGLRAAEALNASVAALDNGDHELASLLTAKSPRADDIVRTARRLNATIVEYLVTPHLLLAWVVEPGGTIHTTKVDVDREKLEALTRAVRSGIEPTDAGTRRRSPMRDLRELDRLLIAPLAQWLPRSPDALVAIVPHGTLALLPFAALEDASGRPLIERHVLSFAPAASVFEYTQSKRSNSSTSGGRSLVIADPRPPSGSGIEQLPGAREEGQRVAERLGGTRVRLLDGPQATEAAVKREAGRYSLLHFATHGLVAPDRPLASSLVLGEGDGDDGYLRVDEIFGLDLSAELVVLSGCSTGLGRLTGDGVIGLTRAFLYAGTPTVVVSQWNVSDRATVPFMDRFYAELTRGRGTAEALRLAALATRRQHPQPSAWAAFEVVGEPR